MKWFKHECNASESTSINGIRDSLGKEGYFYYFALVELLGSRFDGISTSFEINLGVFKRKLDIKTDKTLSKVLKVLVNNLEISIERKENLLKIDYPKLLEIKDNHTRNLKATSKQLRKKLPLDKELELELEEDKELKLDKDKGINPKEVFKIYNETLGDILPKAKILSDARAKKVKITAKQITDLSTLEGWTLYFTSIRSKNFLRGSSSTGFRADFLWLITTSNALKVLEGRYDSFNAEGETKVRGLLENNPYKEGEVEC